MDLIDTKYIGLISPRLSKFKKVKSNLYNFRCPVCGDSKKNKNKARAYIYAIKNNTNFKCHNCGVSLSFNNFLKDVDPQLHKQYSLEKFKSGFTGKNFVVDEPEFVFEKPKFTQRIVLPLCSEVEGASTYLRNRGIDPTKFYFAEDFGEFVRSFKGMDHQNLRKEPRIVIPIYYKKNLIGFQGRALDSKSIKYITIMLEDGAPKIYGLDTIDQKLPVYVVEGPFDSTFINNSVALCGADGNFRCLEGSSLIFVYDNEPRNPEIIRRIKSCIERGESVVIWPTNITEKDINDMVLAGHNVQEVIESNTHSGLEAQLKFNTWKKI
ncbi:DNA primase [Synechococcus phage S-T4]|uniref:DNA primase n=1 Tax=Synechococcus phage S-T4 TaxID=2268578 RepID=A0A385EF76_9CAUD|nr:DNA primase [Synechococcus phage S-T4]AXQ70531.1 DNA primase [Synechococcus phage S-T4]